MFDKGPNEPSYYPGGSAPMEQPGKGIGDYAGDASYYAGAAAGAAKRKIKKILPYAVVGIIAIVIIYFVLGWLGSNQTITFDAKEVDGAILSAARLTIKSGNTALQGYSNKTLTGPITVTLQPGEYTYTVSATDHKSVFGAIKVPGDTNGGRLSIELAKDIDAKFDDPVMDSTSIYAKQTVSGTITITNTGDTDMINEELFLLPATKAGLDINFTPSIITISAGSATSISFSATLKTAPTTQTKLSRTIKIRGTTASKTITLDAMPSVKSTEVKVSVSEVKMLTLMAGTDQSVKYTIKNNNKTVPMRKVRMEVVPDSSSASTLAWVRFNEADAESKAIKTMDDIAPATTTQNIELYVEVPIDAKIGSEFNGNLVISSLSIDNEISLPVNLKVTKDNTVKLTLTTTDLSISCDADAGTCPTASSEGKITLKNEGTTALSNIAISLSETGDQASDERCLAWMTNQVTKTITKLEAGKSAGITFDFTPIITDPDNGRCFIKAVYTNPVTNNIDTFISDTYFEIKKRSS